MYKTRCFWGFFCSFQKIQLQALNILSQFGSKKKRAKLNRREEEDEHFSIAGSDVALSLSGRSLTYTCSVHSTCNIFSHASLDIVPEYQTRFLSFNKF